MEELNVIVDFGGTAEDVYIHHKVWNAPGGTGDPRESRSGFCGKIRSGQSSPLKNVTSGRHFHTISAETEEVLDAIEEELRKRHFLEE